MSNPVTLVATTFQSTSIGTETYGFRLYDDKTQYYDNNLAKVLKDDLALLEYALTVCHDEVNSILDYVQDSQKGMTINNQYYDWDEIKGYFV